MLSHSYHIISTYNFLPPLYLQPTLVDFYKCELSNAKFSQSSSNGRFLQPGWDCNLKNLPSLRERTDHWLEINESLCLGCLPLQRRRMWLDTPLGNGGGEKGKKKKSPGLSPVPWPVIKEVKEQRVLFSPWLLIPAYLDLKSPISAPDQALGRTLQISPRPVYFPDQPGKDPGSLTSSGKVSLWIMQLLEHFYLNKWHKCPGFMAQPCEMKVQTKAPPGEAGFCVSSSPLLYFVLPPSPERWQAPYLWTLLVQCSRH